MPCIAIQFARFGPYHLARINSAVEALSGTDWNVVGLETAGSDATYEWEQETAGQEWRRLTVFPNEEWESIPARRAKKGIFSALDKLQPNAVAVSGWGSPDARACLNWCTRNGSNSIVMSETREVDGARNWLKERLKRRIIRQFNGGLVGARSHRDYLLKLGVSSRNIHFGYNVVDNHYFRIESDKWRYADRDIGIRPYFLASNRFVERKNLDRLVAAFARLPKEHGWNLCLLGDGKLKKVLVDQCRNTGLTVEKCAPWDSERNTETPKHQSTVYFPGFRQIEELPRFYAHAACFVHSAMEEPWGLVINEAMACGLPILSSKNAGAAEELVEENHNGFLFDPRDENAVADAMARIANLPGRDLLAMGQMSSQLLEKRCPTEAFGKGLAECLSHLSPLNA